MSGMKEQLPTRKELGGLHDGMHSAARSSVGKTVPAEYAPRRISFTLYNLQLLVNPPRLDLPLDISHLQLFPQQFSGIQRHRGRQKIHNGESGPKGGIK